MNPTAAFHSYSVTSLLLTDILRLAVYSSTERASIRLFAGSVPVNSILPSSAEPKVIWNGA